MFCPELFSMLNSSLKARHEVSSLQLHNLVIRLITSFILASRARALRPEVTARSLMVYTPIPDALFVCCCGEINFLAIAKWAAINEEDTVDKEDINMIIEYDEETGIPVDDSIMIIPPDNCEFSPLPSAIGYEDDAVMEDILPTSDSQTMDVEDFTEAQAALRAKIHQSFKHALDNLQAQWKEHLGYITESRYLQTFYRPPAECRDIVARLRHLAKYEERLWHHEMCMPRYAFEDILERIQDDPVFHNNPNQSQMDVERQLAVFLYRAG
ncbi:uncharacterized protein B0H18DRAFT_1126022 [Fomitopsis serialis]|uniref:uncharacterized protein n=1 Tax=Fomitopsis serialis TaxID=139415 RepID=UPI002007D26F|nr:uncharacterized protein B0H18DRAFT_1126022 [Neoantrodia serialis]KAH9913737.1 hypothetical protein B0H18DRAFT_1126022 [Neoantrodia serialis]